MSFTIKKRTLREIYLIVFSIVVAAIPWPKIFQSVNHYPMVDREVYREYFLYQTNVLDYLSLESAISYISAEFLWHLSIGKLIDGAGVPVEIVFISISFLTIFTFSRIIYKHAGAYALPLIVNPLVVDLAFSQLRLALAVSILGICHLVRGKYRSLAFALAFITPFIHTASLIFLAIYAAVICMRLITEKYKKNQKFELLGLIGLGAFISILIGPLREIILSSIGDRRADYHDMSSSTFYSLFWMLILVPICINYRNLLKYDFSRYTIVILSIVSVNVIHGGYSTRFLAAALPFIIATLINIRGNTSISVFLAFVTYSSIQWLYWFRVLGGQ